MAASAKKGQKNHRENSYFYGSTDETLSIEVTNGKSTVIFIGDRGFDSDGVHHPRKRREDPLR
jgi:hypothetical protein